MKLHLLLLLAILSLKAQSTIDLSDHTFTPIPCVDMYRNESALPNPCPIIMFQEDDKVKLNFTFNESAQMKTSTQDQVGTYFFAQSIKGRSMICVEIPEEKTRLVLELDATNDDDLLLEIPLYGASFSAPR